MTAYNMEQYIDKAIESCLNQTYKDIELIIVEDCSTDNTLDIIKSYKEKDDRIVLMKHDVNKGAGWGRRNGINMAVGDYFITVDADDWLSPTFIESLVTRAMQSGADVVSGGITIERGNGYWEKTCYGDVVTTGHDKVLKFWGEKIVFMNNKIIRTSLRDKVPYCTRRFIEDTPSIIPMLWYANQVDYVSDTGYHYRMQDDSLTHKATPFKYALYRSLCCMDLIDFFKEYDKEILQKLPLSNMLKNQLEIIKQCKPTTEMIEEYHEEWMEMSRKMLS
jgi:glycosyltransferase involved in cell wall biosynthesis